MADRTQKLGRKEKVGYAMGDVATNFFFQSMILYQTRFYTDTVGLSAVAVGTMFLVLRLGGRRLRPGHRRAFRPDAHPLGQVPALDALDRRAVRRDLLARLRDAGRRRPRASSSTPTSPTRW